MGSNQRRRPHPQNGRGADHFASDNYPTPYQSYQPYDQQRRWSRPQHEPEPPLRALLLAARRWVRGGDLSGIAHDSNNSLGVGVALLAIFLFQFRGTILATVRQTKQRFSDTWHEGGPILVLYDLYDYFRSRAHSVVDALFRLQLIFSSAGLWGLSGRSVGSSHQAEEDGTTKNGRGGRRRRLYDRPSSSSLMPDLELVAHDLSSGKEGRSCESERAEHPALKHVELCQICGYVHAKIVSHTQRRKSDQIEPAFLSENEYPSGWLVFDPVYGVIPKEEAEKRKIGDLAKREDKQIALAVSQNGPSKECLTVK